MLDDVKTGKDRTVVEVHLFRTMGLDENQQQVIHDLALHAASQAIESAKLVATTAPEDWMMYPVLLVSLLLCANAVNSEIVSICERQLSQLDPKTRAFYEEIVKATREGQKAKEARDFDGKYR
jgi:hypothetical protein